MARVLVVEDERDLQQQLEHNLRQAGHVVLSAPSGRDGLDLVRRQNPELLVLDSRLPDIPGTQVCRVLRQDPRSRTLPIVLLTARDNEADRIVGLELGVDDCVTRPFSMRELLLRIEAVLRRVRACDTQDSLIQLGHLRVDREAHRVWVGSQEVVLTALEFKLLVTLYDERDRVQTRSTLLDRVWGKETDISSRTVDTHVKRLREKLGPAASYIETVRGVGYRFAGESEGQ